MQEPLGHTKLKVESEVTNTIQEAAVNNFSFGSLRPATYLQAPESLLTPSATRSALDQNESRKQVARHQGLSAQQSLVEEEKLQNVKEVIADLLNTLQSKIQAVKSKRRNTETTIDIAEELYKNPKDEQIAFEKDLNTSDYEAHMKDFKRKCTSLIEEARPRLEEDLGFGDVLNSLLQVINGLINTLSSGKYPKFFSRTNKLSEAVDEFADQVELKTSPNKV